ncbi:thiamine pyrophosphate-dependent dehydrogenase E1 component subunit alpha [Mycobacterium antarcticum]|uniref:thiamine pyrophosphate-dependent dehydrogenase E1 component subunit alpha n=1 Tax=Mycolicibacterium sp. TUM20984 TaxID=3023368 RepID=UPI0024E12C99|nr:thiamine pyrophosphate-dependent dehydrogenase E1 component subunit alpha [Mycolicibacterium sp. TUM20984]
MTALPRLDLVAKTRLFRRMATMRYFEDVVGQECERGTVHGEMHLAMGHEGVAAVLERHVRVGDAVVSTHRPHLHALVAGVDPVALLAELFERDGLNHGKGGHMHLFDREHRFMCTGIVGASAPIGLGYALAQAHNREGGVTVVALGDAAMNQGAVFESMNLAAVMRLPVLFVVEDNDLGISVRKAASTAGELVQRGEALGIAGFGCDGRDVDATEAAMAEGVAVVRGRRHPALVVAEVDRLRGHYEGDAVQYRSKQEKEDLLLATRDPLARLSTDLEQQGVDSGDLDQWQRTAAAEVDRWREEALQVRMPDPATATAGTWVHD